MQRRHFLTALSSLPAFAAATPPEKITSISHVNLKGKRQSAPGQDNQHQVQANHIYDELRPKPYRDNPQAPREANVSALYLTIKTAGGLEGLYGPIDSEAARVVEAQLKPFLIGKDALAGETLYDQMYRWNRHARSSHPLMAISAIDNCLWDLRGRYFKTPVYRLLGGPTRPSVEAYGSCLGFSVEPEAAARKAAELKAQGFRNQKWFLAYGPGDGVTGLNKNVELVRVLRQAVGDDVQLMFDAYMGWSLDYAIAWAKQVEQFRPRWIEEAFPPDKLEAFADLHKATSIPVAAGEHIYGRYEANRYLNARALSVLQSDPEWCGGISELVKICAVASLYDAQVIPHGHSVHSALHVVAAQSPATCPLVEFLITKMRSYYHFEKHQLTPVKGMIELSDRPGFGIEIDPAKVTASAPFQP